MAGAIIRGMAGGGFRGENIWVYDTDEDKLNALYEDCGITICPSGESVASGVDTLVLAVKPQVLPAVLPALSATLHRSRPLVISIAAGKTLASLEELLGEGLPLIRVMPNINAKVNESISAFCGNRLTEEGHKAVVRRIFEAVGEVIELEEKLFSAFSVIASCSPAYTLLYVDALAQAVKTTAPEYEGCWAPPGCSRRRGSIPGRWPIRSVRRAAPPSRGCVPCRRTPLRRRWWPRLRRVSTGTSSYREA